MLTRIYAALFAAAFLVRSVTARQPIPINLLAPPAAAATRACVPDKAPPSAGDVLLAKRAYKEAEASYRATLAASPANQDAQLGVVRTLIEQDRVTEASNAAAAMLTAHPGSALAEVAVSEAAYRAGDPAIALEHANLALKDDACDGRVHMLLAAIDDMQALYANGAKRMKTAHALRPTDEWITRGWLHSLPSRERLPALKDYLARNPPLADDRRRDYQNEVGLLETKKPGECHVTSSTEYAKTPMKPIMGDGARVRAFGLDASFNGKRRRMEIDTGASGILLTDGAARALKLVPEYQRKTGGVGDKGEVASYLTHVASIRIGDLEVHDCVVEVAMKTNLEVDGLIGADVFDRWLVTLDYQAEEMRLAPVPPRPAQAGEAKLNSAPSLGEAEEDDTPKNRYIAPEMEDWTRVLRIGHGILLPTRLRPQGPLHYLIMDTGASKSSLSVLMGKEAGGLSESSATVKGISGAVNTVYTTKPTPLYVGGRFVLAAKPYYAFNLNHVSNNLGFEIGGLLGIETLQRLTIQIDYRDNLLKLTYDPKHDEQKF